MSLWVNDFTTPIKYSLMLLVLLSWSVLSFADDSISSGKKDDKRLVLPNDLSYRGAFKFPETPGQLSRWGYGGSGLTYTPKGNPKGPNDGYPGSLFGIGHDWHQLVSEISIPRPVISRTQDYSELNAAQTLQPFADITGGLKGRVEGVDKVGDLAYVQREGSRTGDRLYWTLFKYYNVNDYDHPCVGASSVDLSNPLAKGVWHVGPFRNPEYHAKKTGGYLFDVPKDWADRHLGGKRLISGRGHGAGYAGNSHGPAMYAFAPVEDEKSPSFGAQLDATVLVMYPPYKGYFPFTPCDNWQGASWVQSGHKSAVVIVGSKGIGEAYYGNGRADDCSKAKGYHCAQYETQFLFYDPKDLAAVVRGEKKYFEVLPYAIFRPKQNLWPTCDGKVGGAAFDSERGFLYVVQVSLGERPIVHVFAVKKAGG